MDEQDKRIEKILGKSYERNLENELRYYNYLRKTLKFPCRLTGMQDFPWEEPYVFGGKSLKKYEKLKKKNPSYTDEYELIELLEPENEVFARVKRLNDQKIFAIGLSWLKCTDSKHQNYKLIDDYAVWHDNY